MQQLPLLADRQGTVEILEQFWPEELQEVLSEQKAVPPLIAYAKLMTSLDSRNRETAERIKAQYLN
ncbi:Transcriptional regulator, AbiEi antitoxin, Type IV TA system [bacterium A37T11]|nr:Transcriptional regulator, AbiEi antitoxin, Type IV TA system [bacterium A37T11]